MIYSILFIDAGGSLVHAWERTEMEGFTDKKPFIASLIKALMDFGGEVIATPQRVNFGNLAMTFFPLHVEQRDLWIIALSDVDDPSTATKKCVDKMTNEIKDLLLAMAPMDGITFDDEKLASYVNREIDKIIQEHRKRIESVRSAPYKSLSLSVPISLLITYTCFYWGVAFVNRFGFGRPEGDFLFYLLISLLGLMYGFLGGIIAGNRGGGAITGYFSTFLIGLLFFSSSGLEFIVYSMQIAVFAFTAAFHGLAGWYGGKMIDDYALRPPHQIQAPERGKKKPTEEPEKREGVPRPP